MKKLQKGRSMIEMLGVLAIIGVLSIGGLAGYTMAMNRHRANTALDYAQRAMVAVQTTADGTVIAANTACNDAAVLNGENLAGGLSACTVQKTNTGVTTVSITFSATAPADAFAQRTGATNHVTGNRQFTLTDENANNVWQSSAAAAAQ